MAELRLNGLVVRAGSTRLLGPVDYAFAPGRATRIEGPSGAGKSSLLRALSHLEAQTGGTVTLDGKTPSEWGVPAYRRRVLRLSQRPAFKPGSVHDCLERPFHYRVAKENFDLTAAKDLLRQLGLRDDVWDLDATALSEGQAQRVALAQGLLLKPDVLLLDEPTSALDDDNRGLALEVLKNFLTADRSLIIITHQPEVARALNAKGWQPAWIREPVQ